MKKVIVFVLLVVLFYSCGSNDRGELVGVKAKKEWFSEKPYGMALVPGGSFTMGKQDQDISGIMNAPSKTVTVRSYYMDETEITNNEYKEFVQWVRDSIVRTKLGEQADYSSITGSNEALGSESSGGIQDYAFPSAESEDATPYQKYMFENYWSLADGVDAARPLNWDTDLVWKTEEYPDVDYVEVMDSLFINEKDAVDGVRTFDTKHIKYRYSWFDGDKAVKNGGDRKDFLQTEVLQIYPDTTAWVRDFNYSYNDPMHQDYFHHQSYGD